MSRRSTQAILAASLVTASCSQQVLDLSSVKWTVTSPNFTYISVPGKLPSQAHIDLYAAQVIGNPLFGLNDFNLRWIGDSNWTYTSESLNSLSKNSSSTWLLFNGLDTFSSIELCGKHVASTNNQFRQYYFEVSDILSSCQDPVLSINFGSATVIANATANEPGQETWPYSVEGLFEFPNRQFIRKEQNDFGWDWGPAFAPAGPWQPAYVIQLGAWSGYIRNTLIDVYREGQLNLLPPDQSKDWVLNASLDYMGSIPTDVVLNYVLQDSNNATILSGQLSNVTNHNNTITGGVVIPRDAVDLWWPVGMGPQTLYKLSLNVVGNGNSTIASVTKRMGFRTIILNELPISQAQLDQGIAPGNNWHFEINGHEFYAKGSNFIPPDPFWPTVTEARLRQLFESVVDGNQNMLRVWSSGAYSPDFMYDLADEMGIMLWSEFEFGDALYPVDQAFLDNVKEEVFYQVRRVNHHPSLAFWAGGNELENLELYLVNQSAPDQLDRYMAEYETLFLDTIAPIVFGQTRSISYSPSSTSNGWQELNFSLPQPITERYENVTPGSIYGDTDHYDYDSSHSFNFSTYPVGRFANEFGYHSMPSLQTWQQAVDPSDLHFNSSVITLRNHHYPSGGLNTSNYVNGSKGMGEMTIAAQRWYPVPNKRDPLANFSAWCQTTQIFQADYYSSQIQFYRRGSAMPERQLGSLYWQLEDQWQAPTWAGIEYDGRWKVLHYVAKDIYQPVIISPFLNVTSHDFEVWVISDLWSEISASVSLSWYDWSGNKLNVSNPSSAHVRVGAINATQVLSTNTNEILSDYDPANSILVMEVSAQGTRPNSKRTETFTHKNWFHADRLSNAKLVDPGLELSHSNSTSTFTVKATKGVAAWVWLDYPSGAVLNFDANSFWLLTGEEREVGYTVKSDTTGGKWIDGVTVRSLWDNTVP
ncbi:putative beta-mannosidase [Lindgomyces ingoldianus]|uniref:Beta-mannosidase n=1 Tax=Lindgomyces ingoldianus TaxID=673940 RepID=A0ACB6R181_9PLEO|nr:putative beta-mannosidase [Lindgomyces ingoldianus]KAF2472087.1 putative beta-mannosidase [Lindgomyces ingoldianus]